MRNWSSWLGRSLYTREITGSIPVFRICRHSSVVERDFSKVQVMGSNPIDGLYIPLSAIDVVVTSFASNECPRVRFPDGAILLLFI